MGRIWGAIEAADAEAYADCEGPPEPSGDALAPADRVTVGPGLGGALDAPFPQAAEATAIRTVHMPRR
jgi:hypothetical protein